MQLVIDNLLINYEILGVKNKNTLLFLHGWGRNLKDWQQIGEILSQKNRVILIDLPGFGNSSTNKDKPFDTHDYAQLINKFITKLNLTNLTLIGHSFGGKVSVIIASENANVKKLVLVDASGINEKSILAQIKIGISKIIRPLMLFLPTTVRNSIFNVLASDDYKTAGNLSESFKKIVAQDIENEARKIKVPTLIVWGDKDKEVTTYCAKRLRSLIPNSTLRIVWNRGHDPFLEKPYKFLEIVQEFIS